MLCCWSEYIWRRQAMVMWWMSGCTLKSRNMKINFLWVKYWTLRTTSVIYFLHNPTKSMVLLRFKLSTITKVQKHSFLSQNIQFVHFKCILSRGIPKSSHWPSMLTLHIHIILNFRHSQGNVLCLPIINFSAYHCPVGSHWSIFFTVCARFVL